jgi:hypothetical protein
LFVSAAQELSYPLARLSTQYFLTYLPDVIQKRRYIVKSTGYDSTDIHDDPS